MLAQRILKSLRSEGLGEIAFEQICQNVKDEAGIGKYTEYYQRFVTEGHTLKTGIGNYIEHKHFNTETVDLILNMICNNFGVTAVVYQLQNGKLTEMSHPP